MAAVATGPQGPGPYPRHDVAVNGGPPNHTPPQSIGSSSASASSSSPTSPPQTTFNPPARVPHGPQNRPVQIGRPKPMGFVPAALRPTERPRAQVQDGNTHVHRPSQSRSGPPTPPQSLHGSTDSLAGTGPNGPSRNKSNPMSGVTISGGNPSAATRPSPIDTTSRPPSSRATSVLNSPTSNLSSLSLTGLAAAASSAVPHPTRAHWKPDAMAPTCDATACPVSFTTFVRRHHCRRCGGVFCHRHASRQVALDGGARMVATPALSSADSSSVPGTPHGNSTFSPIAWNADAGSGAENVDDGLQARNDVGMWRACDSCHAEWLNWIEGLREAAENAAGDNGLGSRMRLPPVSGVSIGPDPGRKSSVVGSVAGSVPRDWSWSTF